MTQTGNEIYFALGSSTSSSAILTPQSPILLVCLPPPMDPGTDTYSYFRANFNAWCIRTTEEISEWMKSGLMDEWTNTRWLLRWCGTVTIQDNALLLLKQRDCVCLLTPMFWNFEKQYNFEKIFYHIKLSVLNPRPHLTNFKEELPVMLPGFSWSFI